MDGKKSISSTLNVGDQAPDFELSSQSGEKVRLRDFKGAGPVVVYFYPKDNTPGCTAEACSFRDQYESFKEMSAEVIGISSDSPQSHENFSGKYQLPFVLLCDEDQRVRKLYGVRSNLFGLFPGRFTFVIDSHGVIQHIFASQLQAKRHVSEALNILRGLAPA